MAVKRIKDIPKKSNVVYDFSVLKDVDSINREINETLKRNEQTVIRNRRRQKQLDILNNCRNQLEQICGNKQDNIHHQKPHTKSLKKDDRDMKPRDKLRRKRLKEERNEETF